MRPWWLPQGSARTLLAATLAAIAVLPGGEAASAAAPGAAPAATYRVTRHIALDAATRWDYAALDPVLGRVFVTLGDHVAVAAPETGQMIARIDGLEGAHGVAFAPSLGLGFISNGKSSKITTFDFKTLAVLRTTAAGGENPDALLYLARPGRLYSFNGKSHDISVIDPATGKVEQRIAVPGRPEFVAADAAGTTLYLNLEDVHQLAVIDLVTAKVARLIDLKGCEEPTGLDFDPVNQRVFSVCANGRLMVTAPAEGRIVASLAIGKGPDAVVYDAQRRVLLSTNGDSGTLSVVEQQDADHYRLVQTLPTAAKARTLAYQPTTGTLFVPVPGTEHFELLVVEAPLP
jgi:YVTN family beta-propeller protein